MRYFSRLHPARPEARRPLAAVCVAIYLLAWIGVPLPVIPAVSAKASAGRFPCEHHHCGCDSAEQCWGACCCMTMPERLAWAKANGVQPPDWVLQSIPDHAEEGRRTEVTTQGNCCTDKIAEELSTCKTHCCCRTKLNSADTKPDAESTNIQKRSARGWISLIQAQRCRGGATEWVASGAVLISTLPCEVRPDMTATFFELRVTAVAEAPLFEPAVPPPRESVFSLDCSRV
ncbi:MAG: hypothetical protein K8T91_03210 [Planctomycetes bacterium]|nr:hypothetical protein [Planctomycetota bacterium]